MDLKLRLIALIVTITFAFISSLAAQEPLDEVQQGIEARAETLQTIEAAIRVEGADLSELRDQLRALRKTAEAATAPLRAELAETRSDMDRLGPVPGPDDPPEADDIAAERARLNLEISTLDGALRRSDLNLAEAERLSTVIIRLRRDQFTEQIFTRSSSILSVSEWSAATEATISGLERAANAASSWRDQRIAQGNWVRTWIALLVAGGLALALFIPVRLGLDRIITKQIEFWEPLPSRRVLVAAARTTARVLPGILGGFILLEVLRVNGAITMKEQPLATVTWLSVIALLLVDGAIMGIFMPKRPAWRVIPLNTRAVPFVRILLLLATLLIGVEFIALQAADLFSPSVSITFVVQGSVAIGLALIALVLTLRPFWEIQEARGNVSFSSDQPKRIKGDMIRLLIRVAAILSIGAVLVGYVALGHYVMTRLCFLLAAAAAIWLIRSLLREGVRVIDARVTRHPERDGEGERLVTFWIGAVIDAIAFLSFLPPAALLLGAGWADVRDAVVDAFLGFQFGGIHISIAKIAVALGLFLALLYLTRVTQRTAETKLFPRSRLDLGVQNSFKTLIGYFGLVLALSVGIGTLGFDLSNLAIIAGALSVGIGFGLQSIVNNFVSGLILLFERPIKVGDWIITSSGEGNVKRIGVRSTEIETFDRSSIILPNSELIGSAVTNWTHKEKLGRVVIAVGTSYDAHPRKVIELLKEVAKQHPSVLGFPEPVVHFVDFGNSSLDFKLFAYLRDITNSLSVRTELRIAIYDKLKSAGVEIPFPQHDVHIKKSGIAAEAQEGASVEQLQKLPDQDGNV